MTICKEAYISAHLLIHGMLFKKGSVTPKEGL
jgi:hypothetical protein